MGLAVMLRGALLLVFLCFFMPTEGTSQGILDTRIAQFVNETKTMFRGQHQFPVPNARRDPDGGDGAGAARVSGQNKGAGRRSDPCAQTFPTDFQNLQCNAGCTAEDSAMFDALESCVDEKVTQLQSSTYCGQINELLSGCFPLCSCRMPNYLNGGEAYTSCTETYADFCGDNACFTGLESSSDVEYNVDYYQDSGTYERNAQRCWLFFPPSEYKSVTITFSDNFQTEIDYDFVSVLSCNPDCEALAEFSGFTSPGQMSYPIPVGGYVGIRFTSDSLVSYKGFEVDILASSEEMEIETPEETDPGTGPGTGSGESEAPLPTCPTEEVSMDKPLTNYSGYLEFKPAYTETADCIWFITPADAPNGAYLQIQMLNLDTVPYSERVVIYYKYLDTDYYFYWTEYTGSTLPTEPLELPSASAKVEFASSLYWWGYTATDNPGKEGFRLSYTLITPDDSGSGSEQPSSGEGSEPDPGQEGNSQHCGAELTAMPESGTIDYPPTEDDYPPNQVCNWYINSDEDGKQVEITFTELFLEQGYDWVRVFQCVRDPECNADGSDASAPGGRRKLLNHDPYGFYWDCYYYNAADLCEDFYNGEYYSGEYNDDSDDGAGDFGGGLSGPDEDSQQSESCELGYRCEALPLDSLTGYDADLHPIVAATGIMKVEFKSDNMINDKGFVATHRQLSCGDASSIMGETGFIEFLPPGGQYWNNMECEWKIALPEDTTTALIDFPQFDTEACCDKVKMYLCDQNSAVGSCDGMIEVWSYGGSTPPVESIPLSTNGKSILVVFTSDGSTVRSGFRLEYDSEQQAADSGAATSVACPANAIRTTGEGIINFWHEGVSESSYPASSSCAWTIAPTGAASVTLGVGEPGQEWEHFETETNFDVVRVFSCSDAVCANGQLVGEFSGFSIPGPVSSSTGIMKVTFDSDGFLNYRGFKVRYESIGASAGDCPALGSTSDGFPKANSDGKIVVNFYDSLKRGNRDYQNNAQCRWIIQGSSGPLEANISKLDTEEGFDVVRMSECADEACSVVAPVATYELSGSGVEHLNTIYTFESQWVLLQFDSDSVVTKKGFVATFQNCKSCNQVDRCPSDEKVKKIIDFDFGTTGYRPLSNCRWTIEPPTPSKHIQLNFVSFSTEMNKDFVRIYSCVPGPQGGCDSKQKRLIATYSGQNSSSTAPRGQLAFSSQSDLIIVVEFSSDSSTSGRGFSLEWTTLVDNVDQLSQGLCRALSYRSEMKAEVNYKPANGYANNQKCTWIISPQLEPGQFWSEDQALKLTLNNLKTEASFDTLQIRECSEADFACTTTFPIRTESGTTMESIVEFSTTKTIQVVFNSDDQGTPGQGSGFEFKWEIVHNYVDSWPGQCPNVTGVSDCPTMDCCRRAATACVSGQCKACPVGTICYHGQFIRGRYIGENWLLDRIEEEYFVESCPPQGFEKSRPKDESGKYIWNKAQCKPCGLDRYTVSEDYKCQPCPLGAVCECTEDTINLGINVCILDKQKVKVNGQSRNWVGAWQVNSDGVYVLQSCPPGHEKRQYVEVNKELVFVAQSQECRRCAEGEEYVLNPNQVVMSDGSVKLHECKKCPVGAVCRDGLFLKGQVPDSVWKADVENGHMQLDTCPRGHQKITQTTSSVTPSFDHDNQQCKSCTALQYIIDPNKHQCRKCPSGGLCDGSDFTAKVQGSTWDSSATGEMILKQCPPGTILVNMTAAARFDVEVQECRPCELNQYTVLPNKGYTVNSVCESCPDGAICDGSKVISRNPLEVWEIDYSRGIYVLTQCMPGYMLVNMNDQGEFVPERQQCKPCQRNEYILQTNQAYRTNSVCKKCPKGADCECSIGGPISDLSDCFPRSDISSRVAGADWVLDTDAQQYYLLSCPRGYQLNNKSDDGIFSFAHQECEPCPAGSECNTALCVGACVECQVGHYKDEPGTGACHQCNPHTYNPNRGSVDAVSCKDCPLNSVTAPGVRGASNVSACSCASGYYSAIPYNSESGDGVKCEPCPNGGDCSGNTFRPRVVGSRFTRDPDSGLMRISYCPPGYVMVRSPDAGAQQQDACDMCEVGSYLIDEGIPVTRASEAQSRCKPCPTGAVCNGGVNIVPMPGFWRNTEVEFQQKRRQTGEVEALVFPCPPSNCEAGNNTCREGHEGPVCGICKENYVRGGGGVCLPCGEPSTAKNRRIAAAVAGMSVLAIALWYLFSLRPLVEPYLLHWIRKTWDRDFLRKKSGPNPFFTKLQGIFKIIITALQVSTSFLNTFRVEWPSSYVSVMGSLWFTKLDLLELPGPACIGEPFSYQDQLLFKTIGPIVLAFILALPTMFVSFRKWKDDEKIFGKENGSGKEPVDDNPSYFEVYARVVDKFWYAVVLLFFVLFPQVSVLAISAFNCMWLGDPDQKRLLAADWREICPMDDTGGLIYIWSVLSTMVYPVGLPLGLWFVLETYNVPSLSMDLINSARLKALLDHCGISHQITLKRCFYQNLMSALGSKQGQREATIMNKYKKLRQEKPELESGNLSEDAKKFETELMEMCAPQFEKKMAQLAQFETKPQDHRDETKLLKELARHYKHELIKKNHGAFEEHVASRLDTEKLKNLQKHCYTHFLGMEREAYFKARQLEEQQADSQKVKAKQLEEQQADSQKAIAALQDTQKAIAALSEVDQDTQKAIATLTAAKPESACNHDNLIDLAKILIDKDKLAVPALGWVADKDNDMIFDANEVHEGRGFWDDMHAKWKGLTGSTDVEFFSDRDFQLDKVKALARAGFLFQTYEVEFWYFELVEMVRKLMMTSVLVFLYPGTPSQLAVALVISMVFLVLFMQVQPYLDPELDFLQTSTLIAQHCTLLYGIMAIMQTNLETMSRSNDAKIVGWVVTFLNMVCVIWPVVKYAMRPTALYKKVMEFVPKSLRRFCPCAGASEDGEQQPGESDEDKKPKEGTDQPEKCGSCRACTTAGSGTGSDSHGEVESKGSGARNESKDVTAGEGEGALSESMGAGPTMQASPPGHASSPPRGVYGAGVTDCGRVTADLVHSGSSSNLLATNSAEALASRSNSVQRTKVAAAAEQPGATQLDDVDLDPPQQPPVPITAAACLPTDSPPSSASVLAGPRPPFLAARAPATPPKAVLPAQPSESVINLIALAGSQARELSGSEERVSGLQFEDQESGAAHELPTKLMMERLGHE